MFYRDNLDNIYFVSCGIGGDTFKGFKRFKKPNGNYKETGMRGLEYTPLIEEAETELGKYAIKKEWQIVYKYTLEVLNRQRYIHYSSNLPSAIKELAVTLDVEISTIKVIRVDFGSKYFDKYPDSMEYAPPVGFRYYNTWRPDTPPTVNRIRHHEKADKWKVEGIGWVAGVAEYSEPLPDEMVRAYHLTPYEIQGGKVKNEDIRRN